MECNTGILLIFISLTVISRIATSQRVEEDLDRYTQFVIVADSVNKTLYQVSTDGSIYRKILESPDPPIAVAFDHIKRQVYWSTFVANVNGSLHRASITGFAKETLLLKNNPFQPRCLAIDSKAELLFFSDDGKGKIEVMALKNARYTKTIILNTRSPSSIQLDVQGRHIYWTDSNIIRHRIERANYDGSSRTTLVIQEDSMIEGLALDFVRSMMFWTDARQNVIYQSGLDGKNIREVYRYNPTQAQLMANNTEHIAHFYNIALDSDHLYFTDLYNNSISKLEKGGTNLKQIGPKTFSLLQGLSLYLEGYMRTGFDSNCENRDYGGCSHICLPKGTASVCACTDDKRLEKNERTCSSNVHANGPDVIWTEFDGNFKSYVRGIKGEPQHFLATAEVRTWTINNPAWAWSALTADYEKSMLYMIDQADRFLVQLNLNGTKDIQPILYGMSSDCRGLAVDWVSGNLYWTDALYNWISVAPAVPRTPHIRTLLRRLDEPHGISLSPQNGVMVWTDWGKKPKIESASLSGENRKILAEYDMSKPTGIVIDPDTLRIFWVDNAKVESMKLDGTDRITIHDYSSSTTSFYSIGIHEGILMMSDQGASGATPIIRFSNLSDPDSADVKLSLQRKPYGIVMYHPSQQPKMNSACQTMQCSQICVTKESRGGQCLCADGYTLSSDGRTCAESETFTKKAFAFSTGDRICMLNLKDATSRLITQPSVCFFSTNDNKYEFRALDFNYLQGDIYFSEVKFKVKSIRRASLKNRRDNEQIVFGTGDVEGIAVDWNANNLYWTDATYKHICISRLDGSYRKVLYKTSGVPGAIVVNPFSRFVFWVETIGLQSKIWWSRMDFSNPGLFVSSFYGKVTGLSIDYSENKLIFVDSTRKSIEYVTMDNQRARSTQFIEKPQDMDPYDAAVFQDYIAFSNMNPNNITRVRIVEKRTGKEVTMGAITAGSNMMARDIIAFDEHNQDFVREEPQRSCATNNGGCEQLCLPVTTEIRCDCVTGMRLVNKTHCVPDFFNAREFLIIADDYKHSIYKSTVSFDQESALKIPPQDRPIALTFDHVDDRLYWTDFNSKTIRRIFLNGTGLQTIHWYRNVSKARIDGLAFEPQSRILYYTDLGRHEVGIMNPLTAYQKTLIKGVLQKPRAIVLDSDRGHMYIGSSGSIDRFNMDGTGRFTIVNTDIEWPSGIAIDFQAKLVYWCDHSAEKIEVADLSNGGNRRLIAKLSNDSDPFGLTMIGDELFWTDWSIRGVFRIRKDATAASPDIKKPDFYTGLNDIIYVNRNQQQVPNLCVTNNGNCSHFCVPVPNGQRVCACPENIGNIRSTPIDGVNCHLPGCPLFVSNGYLENRCTGQVGTTCRFTCNPGFRKVNDQPLRCMTGNVWSPLEHNVCIEDTCPLLRIPSDATVDESCPLRPVPGQVCYHNCKQGFERLSGDIRRECKSNGLRHYWTGSPLVCKRRFLDSSCPPLPNPMHTVSLPWRCAVSDQSPGTICKHVCQGGYVATSGDNERQCAHNHTWTGRPLVCDPAPFNSKNGIPVAGAAKSEDKTTFIALIAGIGGGLLIIIPVIIGVICYVVKKKDKSVSSRGQVRDSSNMTTMPPAQGGVMPAALSYDVASDSINLAFDNPGYVTHRDIETQPTRQSRAAVEAPPLPAKTPISDHDNDTNNRQNKLNGHYANGTNEGFENAMYETLGGATNDYEPLPDVKEITMK